MYRDAQVSVRVRLGYPVSCPGDPGTSSTTTTGAVRTTEAMLTTVWSRGRRNRRPGLWHGWQWLQGARQHQPQLHDSRVLGHQDRAGRGADRSRPPRPGWLHQGVTDLDGCYIVVPIGAYGRGTGTNGELFNVRFGMFYLVEVGGGNGSHYVVLMEPGSNRTPSRARSCRTSCCRGCGRRPGGRRDPAVLHQARRVGDSALMPPPSLTGCRSSSMSVGSTSRAATAARERSSFRREAHVPYGGPDGGDGGTGGGVWLVVDRNVSSLIAFKDHPHRAGKSGTHGQGQAQARARAAATSRCPCPRAPSCATSDGTVLADLVHAGERWLAGGRRPGRAGQRPLPLEPPAGPCLRRAGRGGGGALAAPRAQAHGRRRPRRLPERRQVHADLDDLGGQAQDRRLPLHHPRAEPRRRAPRRRHRVRGRRHPRAHRGGQRGPRAWATSSCATSSGPGCSCCCSTSSPLAPHAARRAGADPAAPSSATTSPSCSSGPRLVVGLAGRPRASPSVGLRRASRSPRSPARGCGRSSGGWPRPCREARMPSCPSPTPSSCTGRWPRATASSATTTAPGRSSDVRPSGRWRCPTSPTPRRSTRPTGACGRSGVDKALARAGARAGDTVHIGRLAFDYEDDQ